MANINNNLNKIKNAVLGVDVRDSIHDGIKAINEEVESTTDRQVQLEGTFDELLINAGNSNAEVAAARVDSTGKSHGTLGKRLNNFDSQIKEKATKQEVDVERKRIDNVTRLAEGSTTGDAELIDGRVSAYGVTYNNIGSAIRQQINDINTNISDVIERVPLSIGIEGSFIQAYNSTISTEGANEYSISEHISVKKYEKIIIYAMGYREAVSILSKCNDDGTYSNIVTSSTDKTKYIYEVTEDMNIVICSNTKKYDWKLYRVKTNYNVTKNVMDALVGFDGTKYNTLYESITSQNNQILSKVQRNTDKLSYNEKCEGVTYIDDKYISPSGNIYTHGQYNPSLCVTENIDTKGYKSILIENLNFVADGTCSLAFYAKDGSVVSVYTYEGTVNDLTLSIPTNCKYVRFTAKISEKNNMSVYLFTDLKDMVGKKEPEFNYCKMLRKIGGIGDSLMSGELVRYNNSTEQLEYKDYYEMSWLSNLCRDTGSECVHYSRGGLTTKTWLENYLDSLKNEENKPSAYYIALGTNDQWRLEGGLGVESDCGTDNETFYGLYSKIINEIKQCNPKAKIFCCSLYFKDEMVEGFNEAIKYMSDLYNCYYVDFVGQYGDLYTGSNSNIYIDGGHFNTFGYIRVGKHILDITNSIIEENLSDFKFIGM